MAEKIIRERDIEKYLCEQVKKQHGEVRKVQWVGRRGAPDRLVLLPFSVSPASLWVELKAPGVKPEAHQVREHCKLHAFGHYVSVIDSYVAVDAFLKRAS